MTQSSRPPQRAPQCPTQRALRSPTKSLVGCVLAAAVLLLTAATVHAEPPTVEATGPINSVTVETLASGTRFETTMTVRRAAADGPTVLITGGMHGNEPAGAAAAQQIADWPIQRGTLIVIPETNTPALAAAKRYTPDVEESLRNLNRNFIVPPSGRKAADDEDAEVRTTGVMAPALWNVVQQFHPDWVLDLHEGFDFNRSNKKSVGSSVIADRDPETQMLAGLLIESVDQEITDPQRLFTKRGPPIKGSLARAAADATPAHAMILETTYKNQRLAVRTRQHRRMVATALHHLEIIDSADLADRIVSPELRDRFNVALYDDGGTFGKGVPVLRDLCKQIPNTTVHRICAADIRADVLSQFDAICCSGGSGSRQARSLTDDGRAAVRNFVQRGGDYIGICAGSYLACSGFEWGLGILDAKTRSNRWRRGRAVLDVQLTPTGRKLFAAQESSLPILYVNGPIWEPHHQADLSDYEVLASFRDEVSEHDAPAGIMVDSPAAVRGTFGKGQVVCFSPHPEQTEHAEFLIRQTVEFLQKTD